MFGIPSSLSTYLFLPFNSFLSNHPLGKHHANGTFGAAGVSRNPHASLLPPFIKKETCITNLNGFASKHGTLNVSKEKARIRTNKCRLFLSPIPLFCTFWIQSGIYIRYFFSVMPVFFILYFLHIVLLVLSYKISLEQNMFR